MSNVRQHAAGAAAPAPRGLGLPAAVSIGVGGMIGAGIFSILGVVASVSGTALPVSFVIGGAVAILAAYSYLKFGVRYPTASVINIDPVVSGKHVGIRSSLQEQTRSASARRRSMPDQPTGSIIMNTAVA